MATSGASSITGKTIAGEGYIYQCPLCRHWHKSKPAQCRGCEMMEMVLHPKPELSKS